MIKIQPKAYWNLFQTWNQECNQEFKRSTVENLSVNNESEENIWMSSKGSFWTICKNWGVWIYLGINKKCSAFEVKQWKILLTWLMLQKEVLLWYHSTTQLMNKKLLNSNLQLSSTDSQVWLIELVGNIPAQRTKLSPLLHQGMEEAKTKQQLLEHMRFTTALKEFRIWDGIVEVGS